MQLPMLHAPFFIFILKDGLIMALIHELLAVEQTVKNEYSAIMAETGNTFVKKEHLFQTHLKTYEPLRDGDTERPADDENPQPITTVQDKLDYFHKYLIKVADVIIQKETANAQAIEDIVVQDDNGESVILANDVPVSVLVQLQNILEKTFTEVYDAIPTLDPAKHWALNASKGDGSYTSESSARMSTKKVPKVITLAPATDKHPEQTHLVMEDVTVGKWIMTHYSGRITPAEKSALLERVRTLQEAIAKAKARANANVVDLRVKIGKSLVDFINHGVKRSDSV